MGKDAARGPVAAIMIGARGLLRGLHPAATNLQDLNAANIVGATPWKQQVMLAIGAASTRARMRAVLNLLLQGLPHRSARNATRRAEHAGPR